jgi:hypothetical protein
VPLLVLTLLSSSAALDRATGQQEGVVVYTGAFTTSNGQPIGALPRKEIIFRLSASGLGGEAHLEFPGDITFESSSGDICILLDIDLDKAPLGISLDNNSNSVVDSHVDVVATSIDSACGGSGQRNASTEDGRITATVTDSEITGKLEMESFRLEFVATTTDSGKIAPPTNTPAPISVSDFDSLLSEDRALIGRSLAASTCPPAELEKPADVQSKFCKDLQKTSNAFNSKFKDKFKNREVAKDFKAISILGDLRKPNGESLLPSLTGTLRVLAVMAANADKINDPDPNVKATAEQALTAMRRLVRILVTLDLDSAKSK